MTDRIEAIERQKMELRAARAAEDEFEPREFEQEPQHITESTSS